SAAEDPAGPEPTTATRKTKAILLISRRDYGLHRIMDVSFYGVNLSKFVNFEIELNKFCYIPSQNMRTIAHSQ
ncbi:hypothetical protein, partial [Crocosphaera sp.]|uniref:hypothetical protein n=1 Tax=Crocosphaera sp. TaxID=2729996 RepID=UPI003F1F0DE0